MLRIENLHTCYGKVHAIKGIHMTVKEGEIVALVGSNGAGKTTLLKSITSVQPPSDGEIFFKDNKTTREPVHNLVKTGIALCPEGRQVFPKMTVLENLELGAYTRNLQWEKESSFKQVYSLFPILLERKNQMAGTLSGGEQQMLAIGRALMSRPSLLLLDEPSLGLAPIMVEKIFKLIQEIRSQGVTILLVEQNASMALSVADRGYVLETGKIVLEGKGKELLLNHKVREAYLGEAV